MKVEGLRSVLAIPTIIGESPIWDVEEQALYWLDNYAPTINRFDPLSGENAAIRLDQTIYAFALRRQGGFVAALRDGFAEIAPDGTASLICDPRAGRSVNFNDGKCDRRGRFWSGTMDVDEESPTGSLFRLDPGGSAHRMDDGLVLSNGLGWSPDDSRMYLADLRRSVIYLYDFDVAKGLALNRRVFIQIPPERGFPDGITVDADGNVWVAQWQGWNVTCYDQDGRAVEVIEMPVRDPTSCAFGGPNLSTLFITTSTRHLTPAEREAQPTAGNLFAAEVGATGLPEPRFAG